VHAPQGPTPSSQYEHSSLPATIKKIFNLGDNFLTNRDAWAGTFEHILTQRDSPRTDCPGPFPSLLLPSVQILWLSQSHTGVLQHVLGKPRDFGVRDSFVVDFPCSGSGLPSSFVIAHSSAICLYYCYRGDSTVTMVFEALAC
jgi:hypothetical protein